MIPIKVQVYDRNIYRIALRHVAECRSDVGFPHRTLLPRLSRYESINRNQSIILNDKDGAIHQTVCKLSHDGLPGGYAAEEDRWCRPCSLNRDQGEVSAPS